MESYLRLRAMVKQSAASSDSTYGGLWPKNNSGNLEAGCDSSCETSNVPDRVRTCNLRLRRPTRYPIVPRGPRTTECSARDKPVKPTTQRPPCAGPRQGCGRFLNRAASASDRCCFPPVPIPRAGAWNSDQRWQHQRARRHRRTSAGQGPITIAALQDYAHSPRVCYKTVHERGANRELAIFRGLVRGTHHGQRETTASTQP